MFNFLVTLVLLLSPAEAKRIDPSGIDWLAQAKVAGVRKLTACGSSKIAVNRRSLRSDVQFGKSGQGYFLTELPTAVEYFTILKAVGLEEAKAELGRRFGSAHLWEVSASGAVSDRGKPTHVDFSMKATVKDCVSTSLTSLGSTCPASRDRASCCEEKFAATRVSWERVTLSFSPDPSVRLRVPGERLHRYCDIVTPVEL